MDEGGYSYGKERTGIELLNLIYEFTHEEKYLSEVFSFFFLFCRYHSCSIRCRCTLRCGYNKDHDAR